MSMPTKKELCEYWGIPESDMYNWKVVDGGLVHKTAEIGKNVEIGRWSKIGAKTTIGNYATIGDDAEIGAFSKIGAYTKIGRNVEIDRWSKIGANAKIGVYATIGDDTKIGAFSKIGAYAKIDGYAIIGNYAKIGDNIIIRSMARIIKEQVINRTPITAQGKYSLSEAGTGLIRTGCKVFTFEEVYNRPEDDWKKARYTEEQWQCVIDFARMVEQWQKLYPLDKAI